MYTYSDQQIHVDIDTMVSFVIQSEQVSEDGAISVSHHINWFEMIILDKKFPNRPINTYYDNIVKATLEFP